ncbi:MAG: hypothetical protein JW749_05075 [Sedimentisphaerales bacterium]|nr:hypothetical protein [Sedimentisphaerales bacterium]
MSISSHLGIVLLVIVGLVTILGVIVIAAIETRRADKGLPPLLKHPQEQPPDKKKY